jgi:hypothetical protein
MLKRLLQILGVLVALVVIALAGFAVYVARTWDRVYDLPLPEMGRSTDPAVLARGEYLIYGPAHCVACHGAFATPEQHLEGAKVPLSGGYRIVMGPPSTRPT